VPRLILILAVILVIVLLLRRVQSQPPHQRRSGYIQLGLAAAVVVVVILTLMGKMHWLGAALTGLIVVLRQALPLLIRAFPLLNSWRQRQANASQQSEVSARFVKMALDHSSGELNGEVLEGPYKDWRLNDMNKAQLRELLSYCEEHDADSANLLSSYLEQRFPEGMSDPNQDESASGSGMNRKEALAVLGLDEDASDDDIVQAHRSLMQKIHPDRGGNDYLAAKLNEAKDFLLKH